MNKMASMTLSFDVKKKLKEKERTRLNMIFLYETEPKDKPIMPNEKWLPTQGEVIKLSLYINNNLGQIM